MTDEGSTEQFPTPVPLNQGQKKPCSRLRVLITDDEESIRMVFKQVLKYGMPEVVVDLAANGAEALEIFKEHHQCVLLMDLHMPVMSGERAFTEIRKHCYENNWEMPSVVFCTGYDPPHDIQNIVSENPIHCAMRKPVTNETLLEALRIRLEPPSA